MQDQVPLPDPAPASRALIIGLGNPGRAYASHRHNIGFRVVEALAREHGLRFSRHKGARAAVAEGIIGVRAVALAKPQAFMNTSGQSAAFLCRHLGVASEDLLVVYDDLDLPLGRLRLRPSGGSGGHRGMRSIIDLLRTESFARLRVGIDRPPGKADPAEYVLQPFGHAEQATVSEVVRSAVQAIECWLEAGVQVAMDRFNQAGRADGPPQETAA